MKRSSDKSQGDIRKFFCTRTSKDERQENVAAVAADVNESEMQETTKDSHQAKAIQICVSNHRVTGRKG